MNIGDYVRTKSFGINKVKWFDNGEPILDNEFTALQSSGYKSSPNIIDLIEVGDYVNGMPVYKYEYDNELIINQKDGSYIFLNEIDIKSIVTKEQYASMEYKVKED